MTSAPSTNPPDLLSDSHALELLGELERNTSDEIRAQRQHFRVAIKAPVILRPGGLSDFGKFRLQGVTGDVSQGGCLCLFPLPIAVGDVFRLEFDQAVIGIPMTFARCVRCILLREDAFEAGFAFFAPIRMPEYAAAQPRPGA